MCSFIPRPSLAQLAVCKNEAKVLQVIKSWRQKRPGNEASVCGEIVVHTEMMLIMKRG